MEESIGGGDAWDKEKVEGLITNGVLVGLVQVGIPEGLHLPIRGAALSRMNHVEI